jgi:hypothetical protein
MWFEFSFRKWVLTEGVNTAVLAAQYKKKFPQAPDQEANDKINLAIAADPTPDKKYVPWIFRELINNRLRLPEDTPVTLQQLDIFNKSKAVLKGLGKELDINKYDRPQLWQTLGEIEGKTTKRQEKAKIKQEGSERIYEDKEWLVIKMTKPEACQYYAKGTKWCTSDPETAAGYLEQGPLFMIYHNGQIYAQAHVESGQLMDPQDVPIPPNKVPEKLRDIIMNNVHQQDEDDDTFRGKRNQLFGIKEKVITYPDGFYWGTSDHKDFSLIDPSGSDEVNLMIRDGYLYVERPKDKDLEAMLSKKGSLKDSLASYRTASAWNKYIVDFILKNKEIRNINIIRNDWNFGDLSEEDRNKIFTARKDLMPEIDFKTSDGKLWAHQGLRSYVLLSDWYPILSMQLETKNYLNYGNWLNQPKSQILKDEALDKSKYSLATTEFLLKNKIEHAPDRNTKHYNSWKFEDLMPEHRAIILKNYPDFLDNLTYHTKESGDQGELLKRLASNSSFYDIKPFDDKTVILRQNDTIAKDSLTTGGSGSSYYSGTLTNIIGGRDERAKIIKILRDKVHSFGDDETISWGFEKALKDNDLAKIKRELPFFDTNLLDKIDKKSFNVSSSLANSIGKHVLSKFMEILYNDIKPFENHKFKIRLKDNAIHYVVNYDSAIEAYKQDKSLKPLENEYLAWKNTIKIPPETLEQQTTNIPRGMDKEAFVNGIKDYHRNNYEFVY